MSFAKVQNLTARLLADENLRREFPENAEKIGAENGLSDEEIVFLKQTVSRDFEFFAESLFFKRLREVEKLLPLTRKVLAQKEFENKFRDFARNFQPASIKKHLEDALKFADFLILQEQKNSFLQDLVKFEQAKLIFHGAGKNFVFRRFHCNIYEIIHRAENFPQIQESPSKNKSVAVWFRFGKAERHFVW